MIDPVPFGADKPNPIIDAGSPLKGSRHHLIFFFILAAVDDAPGKRIHRLFKQPVRGQGRYIGIGHECIV